MERVQKILSNYGYTSRREAEDLISMGKVKVNGKKVFLGDKASEKDKITVNGKLLKKERRTYLMFNKPLRCVTALTDKKYKTVMSYIKIKERVFPVGRLDLNTTGLLLLTNDGDFANEIMHPRNQIKKTYLVRLNKQLGRYAIRDLERGVMLEDGRTKPIKYRSIAPKLVEVSLHEGKNRIVRRVFEKLGYQVRGLERIAIGKLRLVGLRPGRYRTLHKKDLDRIFIR